MKKWLPSIKRDIDVCLKQSQVTCYPERQIEEFSLKIEQLTKEYKAYVRKLRELEPGLTAVPWTDRAYSRKRKIQDSSGDGEREEPESDSTSSKSSEDEVHHLLSTPVLVNDNKYEDIYGHEQPAQILYNSDPNRQDAPLDFNFGNKPAHGQEKDSILQDQDKRDTISDTPDLKTTTCSIGTCLPHSHDRGSILHGNGNVESLSNEDRSGHCTYNRINMEVGTSVHSSLCLDEKSAAFKCITARKEKYPKLNPSNIHSMASKIRNDAQTLGETNSLSIVVDREASENDETSSVQQLGRLNLPYSDSSEEEA